MTLKEIADSPAMRTSVAQLLASPTINMVLDAIEREILVELRQETAPIVGVHHDTMVAARKHKLAGKAWTVAMIRSLGSADDRPSPLQDQHEEKEFAHAVPKDLHPKQN